jgi:RHH-type proline utilization regulon transcriptional repressor/proline dehydrogenase/delta 1-pyrroline-5-carboxylate dehydrogenase
MAGEAGVLIGQATRWDAIDADYLGDEAACVAARLQEAELDAATSAAVVARAGRWIQRVRDGSGQQSVMDAFMQEYDLSSEEGVLLMCLAEALLRIPDEATAERLINEKLGQADWESHLGGSASLFVNASTWGLLLTGRLVRLSRRTTDGVREAMQRLVARSSEPVIRLAIRQAMRVMGSQFVLGRTIEEALRAADAERSEGRCYSFDMLGEAALTAEDAERYTRAYQDAIVAIGRRRGRPAPEALFERDNLSIKLSALHPRYELSQRDRVLAELVPRLRRLATLARDHGIAVTVDAEEADRLSLSLAIFEAVYTAPALQGWGGLGLAVQAYQKRAPAVIDALVALARSGGARIPVRLVKGAYWDTEIKRAQVQGLADYPVYTRKLNTDVAYLACARRMLAAGELLYPMFATHNAHTLAAVAALAGERREVLEFQRLHGMGEALYDVVAEDQPLRCRVYAPVGAHEQLLPYLVRRLLENGANTSFVNQVHDSSVPISSLVADPVALARALPSARHPQLPPPPALYGVERRNSLGLNLGDMRVLSALQAELRAPPPETMLRSLVAEVVDAETSTTLSRRAPGDERQPLASVSPLPRECLAAVCAQAAGAAAAWAARPVGDRAACLDRAADVLEAAPQPFLRDLLHEAGKTLPDAVAEWREAVDFLRYYAQQARETLATPRVLPGPTGEHNELQWHARGVFACISPWNFPLAIFTGQIAAALVSGNTVVAKPAEQTPGIALRLTELLHAQGIPREVLQVVLGDGALGAALVADPSIDGVVFTGSHAAAKSIQRSLAERPGAILPLIAETGGQNAMIVDSSALVEQVVRDVIQSGFLSAGQRCSALRILCLQEEIAEPVLRMLRGAMAELRVGTPLQFASDIGPIIDDEACAALHRHVERMLAEGARLLARTPLPDGLRAHRYFPPCLLELATLERLHEEAFGPVIHVLRYPAAQLDRLIDEINALGYGLTLGVHTRIEATWRRIQRRLRVGNCYVNRSMTGAVVGTQPFGGEGLSGTGPKAGGPHYLPRFCSERVLTVNTAAIGGNAHLLATSG